MEAYAAAHPEQAERLRRLLPAVQVLAELGVSGGQAEAALAARVGPEVGVLGDFRLIREVGRGGMGIVYEAEQISLGRRVALKVLPFAGALDARQLHRFRNEAKAAGQLHHSNVVPVHFVGVERGVHFYAMQYIEGQTLASLIGELRRPTGTRPEQVDSEKGDCPPNSRELSPSSLPPAKGAAHAAPTVAEAGLSTERSAIGPAHFRMVANLGVQTATALEHAHQMGVIHRDIKPANLMVDVRGHLWVADFGLAQYQNNAGLTLTGDLLGTLRYMSPEQALAQHTLVDQRTDIYSLGVTLYELLTLEPAFPGNGRQEVLRRVAFEEPLPIRRVNPAVPRELETIVLKALEKNPADRYRTAQELADDLGRFLEDRPIRARRPTIVQRLAKWGRRHRGLVIAAVAFLLLAVIGLAVSTLLLVREQAKTALARDLAVERERSLRRILYTQDIPLAWQAGQNWDRARMRQLLDRHVPEAGQEDVRGFEWYYLRRRSEGVLREATHGTVHQGDIYCVTYAPDGRTLASCGKDGMIRLWDPELFHIIRAWSGNQGEVNEIAFAPDGHTLASSGDDGTVRLWKLPDGHQLRTLQPPGRRDELGALAYSPDGKLVAAGGAAGCVCVWEPASGTLRACRGLHLGAIHYLAFAPNGQTLAVANDAGAVPLLDPITLRERGRLPRTALATAEALAFSRDGGTLATGSGWSAGSVVLWDVKRRSQRLIMSRHQGSSVPSTALSPDNALLVSSEGEGRVNVWGARTGVLRDSVAAHGGRAWCTAFAPDGHRLATAGRDGLIKLWDVCPEDQRTFEVATNAPDEVHMYWATFLPDGRTLLTWTAGTGELARLEAFSGRRVPRSGEPANSSIMPTLSATGRLVTVSPDQRCILHIWDLAGGPTHTYRHSQPIGAVRISPDGKMLAFVDIPGVLCLWEVGAAELRSLRLGSIGWHRLAFTPDGRTLAVDDFSRILLVDVAAGQAIGVLSGHTEGVNDLAFSPDGRLLASAANDSTVRLWDVATGRERSCHWQRRRRMYAVAFSADGKTLASSGMDGPIIRWDPVRGQELMRLDAGGGVTAVAFSADSKMLAACHTGSSQESRLVTVWYGEGVR